MDSRRVEQGGNLCVKSLVAIAASLAATSAVAAQPISEHFEAGIRACDVGDDALGLRRNWLQHAAQANSGTRANLLTNNLQLPPGTGAAAMQRRVLFAGGSCAPATGPQENTFGCLHEA